MICQPCAEMADYVTVHGLNEGHPPEVCRDHGRRIRACGCQHRPVVGGPPEDEAPTVDVTVPRGEVTA